MIFFILGLALLSCSCYATEYERYQDLWRQYYIIPSQMMTVEDLNALGLAGLANASKTVELHGLEQASMLSWAHNNPIVVPNDGSFMFLFNNTGLPEMTRDTLPEMMQTSLPFGLPEYHYMIDMFLMVPSSMLLSEGANILVSSMPTGDSWLEKTGFDRSHVPLTANLVGTGRPIVAFVFQSSDAKGDLTAKGDEQVDEPDNYYVTKERISDALLATSNDVAKAVVLKSTEFFDTFASVWVNTFGVDSLFHSVFCQVNEQVHEMSYCLKIQDTGMDVSLLSRPDSKSASTLAKLSNSNSPQLRKRMFGLWHGGDDDGDDDDDGWDDECAFDFLNPYDYKYEAKVMIINKLRKMMELLGGCLDKPEEEGDDDDVAFEDIPDLSGFKGRSDFSDIFGDEDEDDDDGFFGDGEEFDLGYFDDIIHGRDPPRQGQLRQYSDSKPKESKQKERVAHYENEPKPRESKAQQAKPNGQTNAKDRQANPNENPKTKNQQIKSDGPKPKYPSKSLAQSSKHQPTAPPVKAKSRQAGPPGLMQVQSHQSPLLVALSNARGKLESGAMGHPPKDDPIYEKHTIPTFAIKARLRAENLRRMAINKLNTTKDTKELNENIGQQDQEGEDEDRVGNNGDTLSKRESLGDDDCVEVTWKRVFTHSLYGEPAEFCSFEQHQRKRKQRKSNNTNATATN